MKTQTYSFTHSLTCTVLLSVCLFATAGHAQTPVKSAAPSHSTAGAHAGHGDMKAMMKGMNDDMANMTMSGNPDLDFARMMRIHHIGALDMANAQLKEGKDPKMLKLAREIVVAQKKEIAFMDKFIAAHPLAKNTK